MWRNFGCEGFEFHGEKLAESAGDSELAHSPFMATQGGEGDEGEAQEGARQVASSGEGRGRLGDPPTAGKPGSASTTTRTAGSFGRPPLLRRAAQEEGRWVYDRWGPRVRKFLYLNPNFWIVTILPPKRNLVPRFRRKVPN